MNKLIYYLKSFYSLFPGLHAWFRFPAFVSWCAISIGIIAGSSLVPFKKPEPEMFSSLYIIFIIAATISLFCGIVFKNTVLRIVSFLLAGSLIYMQYSLHRESVYSDLQSLGNDTVTVYGKVSSPSLPYPDNIRFLVRIDSTVPPVHFLYNKLIQYEGYERAVNGSKVEITGQILIPARKLNKYEFDEYRYLLSNGITARIDGFSLSTISDTIKFKDKLSNHFRSAVSDIINSYPEQNHRAILYAAFLGETEYLSMHLKKSFRNSGIYHLLSISGLHAAMLTAACYFLLCLFPIPIFYRHIIALSVIWLYQIFIGFIPCLFRATIMATIIIISFVFQKKNYSLQAIGIAGTFWLVFSPESLFQPGYQLSFAATFGILTLYPVLNRYQPEIENRFASYILSNIFSSFYISCAGIVSTVPVLLYHFGNISIFGFIANLAAVPLMTIAMWFFFTAIAFTVIFHQAAFIPVIASQLSIEALIACADTSLLIPFSSITLHAMSLTLTCIFIIAFIAVVTIVKKYKNASITAVAGILVFTIGAECIFYNNRSSVALTKFYLENGSMYALRWPDNSVWLFVNMTKIKSDKQWHRSAQTWLRHHPYASIENICYIPSGRKVPSLSTDWRTELTKTVSPVNKNVFYIHKSNLFLHKSIDTCLISNNYNLYTVHVKQKYTALSFALDGKCDAITLHDLAACDSTQYRLKSGDISINRKNISVKQHIFY